MKINQLFRKPVKPALVEAYLHSIGLMGFDDDTEFSKHDLNQLHAGHAVLELMGDELADIYLACKRSLYFERLPNAAAIIVVLRQLLKAMESPLCVRSRESNKGGSKITLYRLAPADVTAPKPCMKWVRGPTQLKY